MFFLKVYIKSSFVILCDHYKLQGNNEEQEEVEARQANGGPCLA